MSERKAMEGSKLPFFNPDPIEYDWDQEIKDIPLRYKLAYPLAHILMHLQFSKVEAYGVENIPEDGGFIMVADHQSSFDPISVYYGMKGKRSMYIMAREEFFHTFYVRWIFDFFHAFPVNRGNADKDSLAFAQRVVKEGKVLLLFPQGARDLTRQCPSDFKPGAALLAREAEADVLPVSLHIERWKKFRPKIIIRYGELIPYEDLGFTKGSRKSKELRAAADTIEHEVVKLWEMDTI